MLFSRTMPQKQAQFHIMTVCSGNICRSPVAERYLAIGLAHLGVTDVTVDSAGTIARDGQSMPDQAIQLAAQYGANADGHQARYLVERHVTEADLIFAMAREHRRDIVSMHPRASRYTFTLREFARLAVGMTVDDFSDVAALPMTEGAERLRAAVALVAARRGLVDAPADPLEDDVVDPYRLSDDVFIESGRQLFPAADVVLNLIQTALTVGPKGTDA